MTAIAASAQTSTNKPGFEINGLFNAGYQANSYKGVSVKGIDQNGSGTTQINFRGLEDIGGGMSAYFRVENDLSIMNNAFNTGIVPAYAANSSVAGAAVNQKVTSGAAGSFANSEILVGLRSSVGDVAFGQIHNAGLTMIQGTVSPLAGTAFGGGYGTMIGADPTLTTTRWANSFRYITPTINGVTAQYIKAFKQDSASVATSAGLVNPTTTSLGVGLNNQVGADELGIKYSNGPLNVAYVASKTSMASFCASPVIAATKITNTTVDSPCIASPSLTSGAAAISTAQDNKQSSLAANYNLGNGFLVAGAMQNTTLGNVGATTGNQSERSASMYTVQYTTGANTFFATTGSVKEKAANSSKNGQKSTFTGIGYNYALSKMTNLVARYETLNDEANVLGLTGTTAYGMMTAASPGYSATDYKRVRSQIGLHMAF